jgi:hypothetical protein
MSEVDPIAETMREMYEAAAADDFDALRVIFDEGFYAFDLGRRFDGMALPELIKQAHAGGAVCLDSAGRRHPRRW